MLQVWAYGRKAAVVRLLPRLNYPYDLKSNINETHPWPIPDGPIFSRNQAEKDPIFNKNIC